MAKLREDPGLILALRVAGGITPLSKIAETSPQAVYKWPRIPVSRVLRIEEGTGIPRHVLRPDIYPPPARTKRPRPSAHV